MRKVTKGVYTLFVHLPCGNTEFWNGADDGPINDQGCDRCESAPDGLWRPCYAPHPVTRAPGGNPGANPARYQAPEERS